MSKIEKDNVISRKPFDLQEAIVLLDVYLSFYKKGATNTESSKIASKRLRALAISRGYQIDEAFRSSMGIQNRLRSIGHIFEGSESLSAPGTQVFREAVELYRNSPSEYKRLLKKASGALGQIVSSKGKARGYKRTKFVKTSSDQRLKEQYTDTFTSVYYALKRLSDKETTVTATDLFNALEHKIKRKDITTILSGASWAREISNAHFIFFDKEQEERKQKQMEDAIKTAESEFISWLPSAVAPSAVDEITRSYRAINTMLVQKKAITQPLVSITQIGPVENALRLSKKIFGSKKTRATAQKLLTAYLAFLREKKKPESTLSSTPEIDVQEDWIRFDFTNSDQFERTVPAYCLFKDYQVEGRNWARILVGIVEKELEAKNTALEILYKQSLLANRKDRPFFLKKKIDGLNCSELSNGYWINVNYSIPRLMDLIQAFCLHCGYQKKDVTIFGVPRGHNSETGKRESSAKGSSNAIDINKAETFLKTVGLNGVTIQELIDQVQPGAAVSSTRTALEASRSVISMPNGRYVHVDAFVDLDEAEEDMLKILQTHFMQFGGYSNNKLLFGAASHDMSLFLNDNDCEDVDSVYSLAQYFFGKNTDQQFTFSYPHIFEEKPDFPLTLKGLMINFARKNGGLLNSENAKEYLQKTMLSYGSLGQLLQISSTDTFLYYDENNFLLTEAIGINKEWEQNVHDKLDNLFRQADVAYVIPRDITITWLNTLPLLPHGLPWTHLFLQEVLRNFPDIGFRPITSELGQANTTIAAAIVPTNSPLQSFPDVVTLYMQDKYVLPKRMACEELRQVLREAGMLEERELIYALPKALNDYRFSWTDENKVVLVRGN